MVINSILKCIWKAQSDIILLSLNLMNVLLILKVMINFKTHPAHPGWEFFEIMYGRRHIGHG